MANLIFAVGSGPSEFRILSRNSMLSTPAVSEIVLCGLPGVSVSLMWCAHARPKTTISSSEFAPSRFAPWTDTQAASPAA